METLNIKELAQHEVCEENTQCSSETSCPKNKTKTNVNWQRQKIRQSQKHQNEVFQSGANGLVIRERHGHHITLDDGSTLLPFNTCSYLGLEHDPRLTEAACESARKHGVQFATARTRLQAEPFPELETMLTRIFCGAPTLTFNSVTNAHLSMIPLLGSGEMPSFPLRQLGIYWIVDKTAHASMQILRALMEQFGDVKRVPFTDFDQVKSAFREATRRRMTPVTVSDSIGSMGGAVPVTEILQLCERYSGYAYIDDAHGTSVYGKNGCGYALDKLGHFHKRMILLSSLSKAFGAHGGAVSVPSVQDLEMVRRFGTTYIFGGPPCLPGVAAGVASARIHLSGEVHQLQERLWSNCQRLDQGLPDCEVRNRGQRNPIRGIIIGDEMKTIAVTRQLQKQGFGVTAAMFPTVPAGEAMLRITLTAAYSPQEIDAFIDALRVSMATSEALLDKAS